MHETIHFLWMLVLFCYWGPELNTIPKGYLSCAMRGGIIMADEMHYASRGVANAALQRQLKELEELINAK